VKINSGSANFFSFLQEEAMSENKISRIIYFLIKYLYTLKRVRAGFGPLTENGNP